MTSDASVSTPVEPTAVVRALLFTDVVDSTHVVERLGDARAAVLWAEHDRRARDLMAACGGHEIDRTDGFFIVFGSAPEAAAFALGYHTLLAELGWQARAGLHLAPVTLRANRPEDIARGAKPVEVEGLAKPIAARLMALARAGQTLLSDAARSALADALPPGARLEAHGHYRLKGVAEPAAVFELGMPGAAPFAPPEDGEKAYRMLQVAERWRPARDVRHNLPAERDGFVGRRAELAALAARFDDGARLVTVLGAGGTGKTRFVIHYATDWRGDWPGGVHFCDLSDARSLEGVLSAVAVALDVRLGKDEPAAQLGHAIAGRGRCLVILDNFEQVAVHAAATVGRWADRAADATFLVTSRERLHLAGEQLLPLAPLSVADEAVDLFVLRARAHQPGFAIDARNRAAVERIVVLLEGLPLAIELAAARIRVLSPAQIVERLADRFRLLGGAGGHSARQATLRAAIDWSWDLLAAWEQAAFAQCSVFEGGFALEAAEAVLDLSAWPDAPPAIDAVQSLVDKSLLRSWLPHAQRRLDIDEPYFGMYLSVHEYAAAKCRASPHAGERDVDVRHGRYYAASGSDEAIGRLPMAGGTQRLRAMALDLDNLVAACRRALARVDPPVAVAAYRAAWEVLMRQGPFALGASLGAQVLALPGLAGRLRAAACRTRGNALLALSLMEEAQAMFREALTIAREAGDRRSEGSLLRSLGTIDQRQGRMDDARAGFEAALVIQRDLGDRLAESTTLANLGFLDNDQGRTEAARDHYNRAIAIDAESGNRHGVAHVRNLLGVLRAEQGDLAEARAHFEEALAIDREIDNRVAEGTTLTNLGCLHQDLGAMEEARVCFEQSLVIHREVGNRRFEGYVLGDLGRLHLHGGRSAEAEACLLQSLAITRESHDRRIEGSELRSLGDLYASQGRLDEARAILREAEGVLLEVGDKLYLGFVLCGQADVERRDGQVDAARGLCNRAEALAAEARIGPASELGRRIAALREALAAA